jgi:hypothetical protein
VGDACWHLSCFMEPSDPVELIDLRHRQKARLARYGRQDWGSWDDRETTEMNAATLAIMKLVSLENEALEGG